MSVGYDLENQLYAYPDIKQPGFDLQSYVATNYEFAELKKGIINSPGHEMGKESERGTFFKHQILTQRLMLFLDNIFLIHKTGTGKTCEVAGLAELFKSNVIDPDAPNGTNILINKYLDSGFVGIRKVLFFTPRRPLVGEFKKELVCRCTKPGTYDTSSVLALTSTRKRDHAIDNLLEKFYYIQVYDSAAVQISNTVSDSDLIAKYDHSLIIFDEAHHFRSSIDNPTETASRSAQFNQFLRLAHVLPHRKLIVMSATPMYDKPTDIRPLANALLPLTKQIPLKYNFNEIVKTHLSDLISFIRGPDLITPDGGGVILEYQGAPIKVNNSQQIIIRSYMVKGEIQDKEYWDAFVADGKIARIESPATQLSIFAFPDGSYGNPGFDKYFPNGTATPEMMKIIRNRKLLRNHSCNYADTLEILENPKYPGNFFIYFNYEAIGVELFRDILLANGYEDATDTFEMFSRNIIRQPKGDEEADEAVKSYDPYCVSTGKKTLLPGLKANRKRFAVYGRQAKDSRKVELLNMFNSNENRTSDYLRILLVAPIGGIGINTSNAVNFIGESSQWNESTEYQAISRIVRASSQIELLKDARIEARKTQEKLIKSVSNPQLKPFINNIISGAEKNKYDLVGFTKSILLQVRQDEPKLASSIDNLFTELDRSDPKYAKVIIRIFKLASMPSESIKSNDDNDSADVLRYLLSEEKDQNIKSDERLAKKYAIDCYIHHDRNVRPTDIPGSPECDYQECDYKCNSIIPTNAMNYDNYDALYSQVGIEKIKNSIINMFQYEFNLSVNTIQLRLQVRRSLLDRAISDLMKLRVPVASRFGEITYLQYDSGILYLRRDFPSPLAPSVSTTSSEYLLSYYAENPILIKTRKISDMVPVEAKPEIVGQSLNDKLKALPFLQQSELLESSVINLRDNPKPEDKAIVDYYIKIRALIPVPSLESELIQAISQIVAKKQGRKIKKIGMKDIKIETRYPSYNVKWNIGTRAPQSITFYQPYEITFAPTDNENHIITMTDYAGEVTEFGGVNFRETIELDSVGLYTFQDKKYPKLTLQVTIEFKPYTYINMIPIIMEADVKTGNRLDRLRKAKGPFHVLEPGKFWVVARPYPVVGELKATDPDVISYARYNVYNKAIQYIKLRNDFEHETQDYYGILEQSGRFLIVDKVTERLKATEEKGSKGKYTGRECKNFETAKRIIFDLAWSLHVLHPDDILLYPETTRAHTGMTIDTREGVVEGSIDRSVDGWSEYRINFYYDWVVGQTKGIAPVICPKIREMMEKYNLIDYSI